MSLTSRLLRTRIVSRDSLTRLGKKGLSGESDSQIAQRLMREALGVSTRSSTTSTTTLDERISNALWRRSYQLLLPSRLNKPSTRAFAHVD
jgi:hypothetical protein